MLKVQVYVLLILGLVAAEMALGLTLFLKFYRVTRTIS
jgi:NADH:ubiquinone oxidoreductase subunit K